MPKKPVKPIRKRIRPKNGQAPKQSPRDKVYSVHLLPKTIEELQGFADSQHFTDKYVLQSLLDHFLALDLPGRLDLLKTGFGNTFSDLLERMEWANHAFSHRNWTWAMEEYLKVGFLAKSLKLGGVTRLAEFKQAFILLEIAMALRDEAISAATEKRGTLFERARIAILNSLVLCQRLTEHGQHRVSFFNMACGWSLLARVTVEEVILRTDSSKAGSLLDGSEVKIVWAQIGATWRDIVPKDLVQPIDRYAQLAMRCMDNLGRKGLHPEDYRFLLNRRQLDLDLLFIRHDAAYGEGFENFCERHLKAAATEELFHRLTNDISPTDRIAALNWVS